MKLTGKQAAILHELREALMLWLIADYGNVMHDVEKHTEDSMIQKWAGFTKDDRRVEGLTIYSFDKDKNLGFDIYIHKMNYTLKEDEKGFTPVMKGYIHSPSKD